MNKAKRLIRAKNKAKSLRNGTYKPTKTKLGKLRPNPNTILTVKDEPSGNQETANATGN